MAIQRTFDRTKSIGPDSLLVVRKVHPLKQNPGKIALLVLEDLNAKKKSQRLPTRREIDEHSSWLLDSIKTVVT